MATLIEGFEVRTVYAGELGRGAYLGRPDARAPRLVADEAEVTAELAGATVVDGRDWAGAMDAVHELGLGLVRLVAAARAGAPRAVVRLAVGNDFLLQVAKLRALRALWARVAELGAAPELVVWVEPSAHGWTVYDPWVNLLRNTAGCFAAIVGGADWVGPRAFDAALGEPDAQARRLAENTFHLLVHEGHVASPGDPAAGSWAIEAWTSELAARAWGVMQDLERHGSAGGDDASVASIAASIGASARSQRAERIVKRLDGIVGTSLYPNPGEVRPARSGHGLEGPRAATPFEALRARAEAAALRPSVFLACLGPLAEHAPRAMWVKGLYEIVAARVVTSPSLPDPAAAVAAWRASGAPLAVLCGADEAYLAHGAAFVSALKEAGARVVLAGRPRGLELPVDAKVWAGMDVVAALATELDAQGARP